MFYNVRNAATLSDAAQSTKSEVRYLQDVHTSTIIRWFKLYQQYGELLLEFAEMYLRNHKSKVNADGIQSLLFRMICGEL